MKQKSSSVSYFSMCMAMILIFALLISLELFFDAAHAVRVI